MPLIHSDNQRDQQEPAMTDWTPILTICYQLRVPEVFLSREAIQESHESRAIADAFIDSVYPLLERLGALLKTGSITDTYVLRRVMLACAAFTNPKDLWNSRNPATVKVIAVAKDNLKTIYQITPWTKEDTNTTFTKDNASSTFGSQSHGIQGTFSDHVIDILAKVLRPCFANVQAQKAMDRAQLTIQAHQAGVREATRMIQDVSMEQANKEGTLIATSESKDLVTIPQLQSVPRPRFQIAPVQDTPNEDDDLSDLIENPDRNNSQLRWDTSFLESIALVEWCALQFIQDPTRVQEVFMLLLAPILALAESRHSRHRTRGFDLMSLFLIRYQQSSSPSSAAGATTTTTTAPGADPRIWIRIFERTGLDQVLERALIPSMTPLKAAISSDDTLARMSLGHTDPQVAATAAEALEDLEAKGAGFRAYLVLILVNTEPEDRPKTLEGQSRGGILGRQFLASGRNPTEAAVTIESLFILVVLGGMRRASPSNEFRTLVLEWTECLVNPVITFDRIRDQMPQDKSLCLEPKSGSAAADAEEQEEDSTFLAIYGMGEFTTKYLVTLVPYICDVLEFPFPSSPPRTRLESLKLAGQASDTLRAVMTVTRVRVSRFRGKIMSSLAGCWANSRIFPSSSTFIPAAAASLRTAVDMAQARLDASLSECMRLCVEICRGQEGEGKGNIVELGTSTSTSGVDMDLKVLQELDPSVFGPLLAPLSNQ